MNIQKHGQKMVKKLDENSILKFNMFVYKLMLHIFFSFLFVKKHLRNNSNIMTKLSCELFRIVLLAKNSLTIVH
jgi:hypothetical protein